MSLSLFLVFLAWVLTTYAAYRCGRHAVYKKTERDILDDTVPEVLWHHENRLKPIIDRHQDIYA